MENPHQLFFIHESQALLSLIKLSSFFFLKLNNKYVNFKDFDCQLRLYELHFRELQ